MAAIEEKVEFAWNCVWPCPMLTSESGKSNDVFKIMVHKKMLEG